jgi:hypothetical protein
MTTRATFRKYIQFEYDDGTFETVGSGAPVQFSDDFIGAGHSAGVPAAGAPVVGYPWVKKIVGSGPPTVGISANGVDGQMNLQLAATSEAEEGSLYFNDSLSITTGLVGYGVAEWRAALITAPSASGVQAALGIGSAWVGGPTNLAEYMLFLWSGSGALTIATNDGNGHTYSAAAAPDGGAAITSDANYHIFRIDWGDDGTGVNKLNFYYDGNIVVPLNTIKWAPSSVIMQPWHTVYKPSGTGTARLSVDKIDIFTAR